MRILIQGGEHLTLAAQCADSGLVVDLLEADTHDRKRLAYLVDGHSRSTRLTVIDQLYKPPIYDLCLGQAIKGSRIPTVSLNWFDPGPSICVTTSHSNSVLVEVMAPQVATPVQAVANALNADLVRLPEGELPVSQRCFAVQSVALEQVMLAGASPTEIDMALEAAGFARGPFETQDVQGVDTALLAREHVLDRLARPVSLPLFARAVAEGRLGRKVGVGWYRYPGNSGKVEDPLIEDMAAEEARFSGIAQTHPDADEIVVTLRETLSAEARDILADNVVSKHDLMKVLNLALGCPKHGFVEI